MRPPFLVLALALALVAFPSASAFSGELAEEPQVNCGNGFVGMACRAVVGLACAVVDFLFGPYTCASMIS